MDNPQAVPHKEHASKKLGELLVELELITPSQLESALINQSKSGKRLGKCLVEAKYITEHQLQEVVAQKLKIPKLSVADLEIDRNVIKLIPADLARRYCVIPVFRMGDILTVAMDDPMNFVAIDEIVYHTRMTIKRAVATETEIEAALEKHLSITDTMGQTVDKIGSSSNETEKKNLLDLSDKENLTSDMPAVELVNAVIAKGVKNHASDIHLEPDEDGFRIRYRIDGIMHETAMLTKNIHQPVVSRIKVMANIDVSEKRLPQDGRFRTNYESKQVDFRVSTLPTVLGEKIVIRILDQTSVSIDITKMGLLEKNNKTWIDVTGRPEGLILVTGPTGSGKTTSLYAVLKKLNTYEKNIITVEDPVEYNLPLINQVQINEKTGLLFTTALRSIVRNDPDIVMVGEIRDLATAEISIRASLTGHLVLSTLHTSDAPVSVGRLIDMGVEPYLVSSSLTAVLAQRLVRVICPHCKQETKADFDLVNEFKERWDIEKPVFYKGTGCPRCNNMGFVGRTAIHELMVSNPEIKELITKKAPHITLRRAALQNGMISMLDDGLFKAIKGITTIDEVLRVCHSEDSKLD